jgi:hypothetical protein
MTAPIPPILLCSPNQWLYFLELQDSIVAWHFLAGGMLFATLLMPRSLGYRLSPRGQPIRRRAI